MLIHHLIMADHGGGATINTNRLIGKLADDEHEVYILRGDSRGFLPNDLPNVKLHYLKVKISLSSIRVLRKLFPNKNATLITNGFGCLVIAFILRLSSKYMKWLHITRGVNFHGNLAILKWITYKLVSLLSKKVDFVFVSFSERMYFAKKLFLTNQNRLLTRSCVVGNGVPAANLLKIVDKDYSRLDKILVVSRVCDQKDILGLIGLISTAINAGILDADVQVNIYGSIENKMYYSKCMDKVQNLKLGDNITFFGETKIDWRMFSDYKYLLHNAKFEGLATILTEASAAGILFVAREAVGTIDFKQSYNEALFYHNTQSFLASLVYIEYVLKNDNELLEWIAVQNQKFVERNLTLDNTHEMLNRLIQHD